MSHPKPTSTFSDPKGVMLMPNCSWDFVVNTLNENEIKRLACCYLHQANESHVNWNAASVAFHSASVGSFRKTVTNSHNKLKAAVEAAGEAALETGAATPSPKKSARPPKRKLANATEGAQPPTKKKATVEKTDEHEEDDASAMPSPPGTPVKLSKPRGRPPKDSTDGPNMAKKGAVKDEEQDEDAAMGGADFYGVESTAD